MVTSVSDNNKRIAKNTLLLYVRMVITMGIGIFTSRIVLQNLGVVDYGINNVVAGMVTMFTFLNSTLASGTQRFITFTLGKGDIEKSKITFSTTFVVHFAMAVLLSIIILIGGLWFMNGQLVIPKERMDAAYYVFYTSIVIIFLNVTQVPYMSTLIAHENMSVYAYMAIYDAVAKLIVAFSLMYSTIDNLKLFAVLQMVISATSILIYRIYCKRKYEECVTSWTVDKSLLKSIIGFSGWNVFGCAAVMFNNQGLNMLLNMFFGTIINAARGIGNVLNGMVMQLVTNFLTAANPQIVKYCAVHEYEKMFTLINNSSCYAGLLMLFVLLPLCFEAEFVLTLWLGEIPDDTVFFTRIILIQSLIQTMARPIVTGIHANGRMKWPNVLSGSVLLSIVPISWVLLKMGVSMYVVLIIGIIPWVVETFITGSILGRYTGFSIGKFYKYVYGVVFPIGIVSSLPLFAVCYYMEEGGSRFLIVGITSVIVCCILIYFFGLSPIMRNTVKKKVLSKIKR